MYLIILNFIRIHIIACVRRRLSICAQRPNPNGGNTSSLSECVGHIFVEATLKVSFFLLFLNGTGPYCVK